MEMSQNIMIAEAGGDQTWTPIMGRLRQLYIQKDIYSGTSRIVEETHPRKEATTKANAVDTNHTLTYTE